MPYATPAARLKNDGHGDIVYVENTARVVTIVTRVGFILLRCFVIRRFASRTTTSWSQYQEDEWSLARSLIGTRMTLRLRIPSYHTVSFTTVGRRRQPLAVIAARQIVTTLSRTSRLANYWSLLFGSLTAIRRHCQQTPHHHYHRGSRYGLRRRRSQNRSYAPGRRRDTLEYDMFVVATVAPPVGRRLSHAQINGGGMKCCRRITLSACHYEKH